MENVRKVHGYYATKLVLLKRTLILALKHPQHDFICQIALYAPEGIVNLANRCGRFKSFFEIGDIYRDRSGQIRNVVL